MGMKEWPHAPSPYPSSETPSPDLALLVLVSALDGHEGPSSDFLVDLVSILLVSVGDDLDERLDISDVGHDALRGWEGERMRKQATSPPLPNAFIPSAAAPAPSSSPSLPHDVLTLMRTRQPMCCEVTPRSLVFAILDRGLKYTSYRLSSEGGIWAPVAASWVRCCLCVRSKTQGFQVV
jgi:hypothetical protein